MTTTHPWVKVGEEYGPNYFLVKPVQGKVEGFFIVHTNHTNRDVLLAEDPRNATSVKCMATLLESVHPRIWTKWTAYSGEKTIPGLVYRKKAARKKAASTISLGGLWWSQNVSTLDLYLGYWQVEMDPRNIDKTGSQTRGHSGLR